MLNSRVMGPSELLECLGNLILLVLRNPHVPNYLGHSPLPCPSVPPSLLGMECKIQLEGASLRTGGEVKEVELPLILLDPL